jgi:Asp-tRNA(Asn)/Glu-tRNA(Gln) amidotransferase A subunit family amidase
MKELNAVAGQSFTLGSGIFGGFRADHDNYTMDRLRNAGFALIGRTAAPEVGIVPATEPRRFGPTRNPWNRDRGSRALRAPTLAATSSPPTTPPPAPSPTSRTCPTCSPDMR